MAKQLLIGGGIESIKEHVYKPTRKEGGICCVKMFENNSAYVVFAHKDGTHDYVLYSDAPPDFRDIPCDCPLKNPVTSEKKC